MSHTPGPWEVEYDIGRDRVTGIVTASREGDIPHPNRDAEVVYQDHFKSLIVESHRIRIVQTDGGYYPPRGDDARLIAAAPDLLAALRGLLEIGKRDMSNPKYDGYFESAKAAIAKAEGQ